MEMVKRISPFKYNELLSISLNNRWLWILAGGCIPLEIIRDSYRISIPKSDFQFGSSVNQGFDRKNFWSVADAWTEFKEIESLFKGSSFVAYTDGSFSNNFSGSGAIIYRDQVH